ncbi:unnamed protein product, partial [Prorocentrum cordatum]
RLPVQIRIAAARPLRQDFERHPGHLERSPLARGRRPGGAGARSGPPLRRRKDCPRRRLKAMSAPQREPTVQVESALWASDARDLFDFEAAGARTRNFDLPRSAKIARVGGSLMPLEGRQPVPPDSEPLLQLREENGAFWVDSANPRARSSSKKLWLVVKDLPGATYELSEGDEIRMGCTRFRVRQLVADASAGVQPELTLPDAETTCQDDEGSGTQGGLCRICLDGDCDEQGPLIRPCGCRGSIESVHLGCLQQWIRCR